MVNKKKLGVTKILKLKKERSLLQEEFVILKDMYKTILKTIFNCKVLLKYFCFCAKNVSIYVCSQKIQFC